MSALASNNGLVIAQTQATLGKNLILARTSQRLTQDQLAEKAGVSRATIAAIESGAGDSTLSIIVKLATALETSLLMILMDEADLKALIKMKEDPEAVFSEIFKNPSSPGQTAKEYVESRVSEEDIEKIRNLVGTGHHKRQMEAAKIIGEKFSLPSLGKEKKTGASKAAIFGAVLGATLVPSFFGIASSLVLATALRTARAKNEPKD
jgi:transcriptional regulator with XRE-family HTH domain